MGAKSRRKGLKVERELVHLLRDAGIPAERIPLSGAAGGSFTGDVLVAGRWRAEVKARANGEGFATLERWLGEADFLVLRRDRAEPLLLFPWPLARVLLQLAVAMQPAPHGPSVAAGQAIGGADGPEGGSPSVEGSTGRAPPRAGAGDVAPEDEGL